MIWFSATFVVSHDLIGLLCLKTRRQRYILFKAEVTSFVGRKGAEYKYINLDTKKFVIFKCT